MKATELMICDWVQSWCEDYEPYEIVLVRMQVEFVSHGIVHGKKGMFYDETQLLGRKYGILEPITLTAEILRENGWTTDGHTWEHNDVLFEIEGEYNHKKYNSPLYIYCGNIDTELKYVHQLQHALRLCGLNELADDFKVK